MRKKERMFWSLQLIICAEEKKVFVPTKLTERGAKKNNELAVKASGSRNEALFLDVMLLV